MKIMVRTFLLAIFVIAQYKEGEGYPSQDRNHKELNTQSKFFILEARDLSDFTNSWISKFSTLPPSMSNFFNDNKENSILGKKFDLLEKTHKLILERLDKIVEIFKLYINKYQDLFDKDTKPVKDQNFPSITENIESSTKIPEDNTQIPPVFEEDESLVNKKPTLAENIDDKEKPVEKEETNSPLPTQNNENEEATTPSNTNDRDTKPKDQVKTLIKENDDLERSEESDENGPQKFSLLDDRSDSLESRKNIRKMNPFETDTVKDDSFEFVSSTS